MLKACQSKNTAKMIESEKILLYVPCFGGNSSAPKIVFNAKPFDLIEKTYQITSSSLLFSHDQKDKNLSHSLYFYAPSCLIYLALFSNLEKENKLCHYLIEDKSLFSSVNILFFRTLLKIERAFLGSDVESSIMRNLLIKKNISPAPVFIKTWIDALNHLKKRHYIIYSNPIAKNISTHHSLFCIAKKETL